MKSRITPVLTITVNQEIVNLTLKAKAPESLRHKENPPPSAAEQREAHENDKRVVKDLFEFNRYSYRRQCPQRLHCTSADSVSTRCRNINVGLCVCEVGFGREESAVRGFLAGARICNV
jgi:hypothetical protein